MDSNGNNFKRPDKNGDQVIVQIPNEGGGVSNSSDTKRSHSPFHQVKHSNVELTEMDNLNLKSPTQETPKFSPSPHRPPKIPTNNLIRRSSLAVSAFSKPKSRFTEPSGPIVSISKEEERLGTDHHSVPSSPYMSPGKKSSPKRTVQASNNVPVTPKTPLMRSSSGFEDEEEDNVYRSEIVANKMAKSRKRLKLFGYTEWVLLVCIWGFLIASLTIRKWQHCMFWGLEIWKWCVFVMVIVCGRLMMKWVIHVLVYIIEKNFLLKNKVLYFIFGVKKSVQVFLWLSLVLLAWVLLINRGVKRSKHTTKVLNKVTRALISLLVGALIWMVKTLLVKLLATNFQSSRYFDRIQESLFHQYVLKTLSGPPLMEIAEIPGRMDTGRLSIRSTRKGDIEQESIDVNKLHKMKQEKVSAWTMKGLVNVVTTSGLSTISNEMDQYQDETGEQKDEITSEWEAEEAAKKIFKNVTILRADAKPRFIEVEDLLRFLSKAEVDNVLPLFEGASDIKKIKRSALKHWVVKVYHDRKSLAHSLNDTKTAVQQLNNILSAVVIVVVIILSLVITGVATVQVFVFISSQMLVAAFIFGNTAKTIFESIIFVFVMHPFDVGDRCVINGVQMIVEEMNILTTVFLRYDSEKIYYPNSVLATKPISNFYRSPDMGDNVEFAVDVSTSIESIGHLKARIKAYIDNKPQHWRQGHSVVVKEIENLNKMKMVLFVTHTMNHQNYPEKNNRRTELVLEMKKIFEELTIKYHLLPQEVHLSYVGSAATAMTRQ
ncbi:hypothetical protein ACHQM5_001699 [Ranunculus cassubicifolius]